MRTLTRLGVAMTDGFSGRHGEAASSAGRQHVEEVEARAARLGITPERVLQEYANIAFARITDIVEWDNTIRINPSSTLTPEQVAAIAEVVASSADKKPYRVKMHDKKPVLDAIGRYLGMFPKAKAAANADHSTPEDAERAREFIIAEFDRLATEAGQGRDCPPAE